ncbi:hypothetical protein [Methanobrevibacter wolinii]|uniref:hypothetical protein n=1 Tax=Methanobrevibacter wolinii TaxID=190977 RepID=UPI0005B28C8B|nr:hypothetical protein [Methanobrevibacter wolinii]MDD5959028.1 hypothetical protein [Methanobrevibacter wolinii]
MVSKNSAAVISFFLPGIGQAAQGKTGSGICAWIVTLIIAYAIYYFTQPNPWYAVVIYFIIGIIAAYYAYSKGDVDNGGGE